MIPRILEPLAKRSLRDWPVVALTGPRQSGKTTLARAIGGDRPYASLEDPDVRSFAEDDPRGFLNGFPRGAVLDEAQRCPSLFSYLQTRVDEGKRMGQFIITGSQQFGLVEAITQSLAGRVAMLTLLPFSQEELDGVGKGFRGIDDMLFKGFYPPVHDRQVPPAEWLGSYIATYVERDVRQALRVQNLATFQRFVRLCATRVGQLVNLSSLASDCGVTHNTAASWLSVLEGSYLVFLLRPYHRNFSKRMIKTPKIYFHDVGLAARLLGITDAAQVAAHPLRGSLFENWVITELYKSRVHRGNQPDLYFWRDKEGHEVDVLLESKGKTHAFEIKSGQTVAADFFKNIEFWRGLEGSDPIVSWLVYGGKQAQRREHTTVLPWAGLGEAVAKL